MAQELHEFSLKSLVNPVFFFFVLLSEFEKVKKNNVNVK
jgi:hypothetical protein